MNIVLSMPQDGQSNNYIIDALQDLGHNVFYIDHRFRRDEAYKVLPAILENEKIDMMLVLYLVPTQTYEEDYLTYLKSNFPHVKYVSWIFDATVDGLRVPDNDALVSILKEYDYFFTVCDGQVEALREKGVNAFWGKEGASAYSYRFIDPERTYDVGFIGQLGHPKVHKERLPLMKKIIQKFDNTIIAGPLLARDEDIISHHLKRPTYTEVEHARLVSQIKVNIAHTGWADINHYFSARMYRLMVNGGFVLANHSNGIEDMFEVGKEVVTYKDFNECLEKIDYYVKHDEEREAIAEAGRNRVIKDYLFTHTLRDMIEVINE